MTRSWRNESHDGRNATNRCFRTSRQRKADRPSTRLISIDFQRFSSCGWKVFANRGMVWSNAEETYLGYAMEHCFSAEFPSGNRIGKVLGIAILVETDRTALG